MLIGGLTRLAASNAIVESAIGTGIKGVGSMARVADVPANQPKLLKATIGREAFVLALGFVTGILLTHALNYLKPASNHGLLVKFGIQAAAIGIAEYLSRKLSGYNQVFQESFNGAKQPSQPSQGDDDGDDDKFERHQANGVSKPEPAQVAATRSFPQDIAFQAQRFYPNIAYWPYRHSQFSMMSGFNTMA